MTWTRSSRCESAHCVEILIDGDTAYMRNSRDPDGPVLVFDRGEWDAFTAGVHAGEFDFAAGP